MKKQLSDKISATCAQVFDVSCDVEVTHPDPIFGDWTTNIALRLSKQLNKNPREVATSLVTVLSKQLGPEYSLSIAGPGFINITVPDSTYTELLASIAKDPAQYGKNDSLKGKKAIIEGTDPNPFKQFHIGHAYSNTIGEAISGLHEAAGAQVIRANYQGDIGMHVAKSLWGMKQLLAGAELGTIAQSDRAAFLGKSYALGATAYKEKADAKEAITELNKLVYTRDPSIVAMYETGRQWSLDYFETQYDRLQTHFDEYYFESKTGVEGLKIIEQNPDVFEKSDGAVVYNGEAKGLHTRVFINSKGFPTYEAKELGLASVKEREHNADISITFTGNEITEYFKVIKSALSQINPQWSEKITHIPHGMVRLPEGKMSSRTGDVITADWLLDTTQQMITEQTENSPSITENTLGAIKYAFLKHRIGGDISFDIDESISLEGNSGPYIQYAHARAFRVTEKLGTIDTTVLPDLEQQERDITQLLSLFPEEVEHALHELSPHHLAQYLYKVAQQFNRFYEKNRVIDDPRQAVRGQILHATQVVLRNGLHILNIPSPDRM